MLIMQKITKEVLTKNLNQYLKEQILTNNVKNMYIIYGYWGLRNFDRYFLHWAMWQNLVQLMLHQTINHDTKIYLLILHKTAV